VRWEKKIDVVIGIFEECLSLGEKSCKCNVVGVLIVLRRRF